MRKCLHVNHHPIDVQAIPDASFARLLWRDGAPAYWLAWTQPERCRQAMLRPAHNETASWLSSSERYQQFGNAFALRVAAEGRVVKLQGRAIIGLVAALRQPACEQGLEG